MQWKVEAMHLEAEDLPIDIVYENDDFAIINKDPGMNTHPTPGEEGRKGTLVNALLHHFKSLGIRSDEIESRHSEEWNNETIQEVWFSTNWLDRHASLAMTETKNQELNTTYQEPRTTYQEPRTKNPSIINWVEKPGIVHRLDKDTSGLIIIAKNDRAMHSLQLKIAKRTIHKTYLALVIGKVHDEEGYIESFIGRDPHDRKKMTTQNPVNPKLAQTKFRKKWFYHDKYTLLEVDLLTGRTHQIRVHLASIGYPIVGDKIYGKDFSNKEAGEKYGLTRQWLHAWKLGFNLFGQEYHFEWELKKDLRKVLWEDISI